MGISALLAAQILDASATGRSVLTGADAAAIRTTLGLGTLATQSPTGTPSASTFLRGDYSWQTIDLSGYLPLAGGTMTGQLTITQGTANTSVLTSTGYSLTGSNAQSLLDVAGTWNTTGTPTAFKLNVTDTASNANSLLMDLQVGGASRFRVGKIGNLTLPTTPSNHTTGMLNITNDTSGLLRPSILVSASGTTGFATYGNGAGANANNASVLANYLYAPLGIVIGRNIVNADGVQVGCNFGTGSTTDLSITRDAADTLAQRRTTNPQVFRIYNTFTDASNYERAKIAWESTVLRIGTEKAGTGSARALELQTDGTTRLTIGTTGLFTIADALNIAVGTTTGTKIGTATTQKLGFFNATPVVQPTAVADATDAASVITQLNALLSRMRDPGLIAT